MANPSFWGPDCAGSVPSSTAVSGINLLSSYVKGDGTDETANFQSAIDASYGGILLCNLPSFKINSNVEILEPITIWGNNCVIDASDIPVGTALNQKQAIYAKGTLSGVGIPVTASTVQGQTAISLLTTGTLAKDDMVLVYNDEPMVPSYGNAASKKGYLSYVELVDSPILATLSSGCMTAMDHTQDMFVQKINPLKGLIIRDLEIVMGGVFSVHGGIRLDYCADFILDNITIRGGEDNGIATWYTYGGRVTNCKVFDSTSANVWNPALNTGYGYVFYDASRDILMDNCKAINCRRGNTGGNQYPAIFCTVTHCHAENCLNAWGTHEPCFDWTFIGNTASGLEGIFLTARGSRVLMQGNRCVGSKGNGGIRVRMYYDSPEGLNHIHLIDNHLEHCDGPGIWLEGIDLTNETVTGGLVGQVVIRGGSIINPDSDGIYIEKSNNVLIDGVLFDGVRNAYATDGNGVYINGNSDAWDRSSKVTIQNCHFRGMLRNAVRADYCSDLEVSNCTMQGFVNNTTASNGVYAYEVTNLTLNNNKVDMSVGYYGYWLVNTDNITIDGGRIQGGSGLVSQDLIFIDHDNGGAGDRNQDVLIQNIQIEGTNRYGMLLRYCSDITIRGIKSKTAGTINFSNCNFVRADANNLTVTSGQLYNLRLEDCRQLICGSNYFHPGASTGAGIYCFRNSGKMEIASITANIFGAFPTGSAAILENVNYVTLTHNNAVQVVGGNKFSITGQIKSIVTDNIPGSVGLWKVDVTGTSANILGDNEYHLQNASKTTLTCPASFAVQTRFSVVVANGRVDNEIDRNGHLIEGAAANYVLNSASAVVEFEYVGGSIGLKVIGGVA
jgi:hypothetical protein